MKRKKVTKITKEELKEMITKLTEDYLNEMDGRTYKRLEDISKFSKSEIQSGRFVRTYPTKTVSNDDIIERSRNLEETVQKHWLKDYIGKTFKFFGEDRLRKVANIMFTLEKITKLDIKKTILVGDVIYNGEIISGDGIIINFEKTKVVYKEGGSRYSYNLEIDIRSKELWDRLLEQIKMSLGL